MQIIDRSYSDIRPLYPIDRFCDAKTALYIDIETTGLSKESTDLYLIGCGYYDDKGFNTRLFFADKASEEYEILRLFAAFIKDYTHLFHFNGTKFDIPYLLYKAKIYDIPDLFSQMTQVDIYKLCASLRYLLFPESG